MFSKKHFESGLVSLRIFLKGCGSSGSIANWILPFAQHMPGGSLSHFYLHNGYIDSTQDQ